MNKIEPLRVGLIGIDRFYKVTTLGQAFGDFSDLDPIAPTPFACSAVIYEENSHDSQLLMSIGLFASCWTALGLVGGITF